MTTPPELLEVEFVSSDASVATLRFRFDQAVQPTGGPGPEGGPPGPEAAFRLYAYAPLSRSHNPPFVSFAQQVSREPGNTSNVLATFPRAAFDLATIATVAAVGQGAPAVRGLENDIGNTEGSAPVGSRTRDAGETLAPNLTAVRNVEIDGTDTTVEFVFDKNVEDIVDPNGFALVVDNGTAQPTQVFSEGAEISADDNTAVEATFTGGLAVDDVARAFLWENTVSRSITFVDQVPSDLQPNIQVFVNATQSVNVTAGGTTTAPDLIGVSFDEENDQVTYTFDQDIVALGTGENTQDDAEFFTVYLLNGVEKDGLEIQSVTANSVTVQFDDLSITGAVTGASVFEEAVEGVDGQDNVPDEIGREASAFAAGETAGPQLVSVDGITSTPPPPSGSPAFTVTFTFDQEFTDVSGGPTAFAVYDQEGVRTNLVGDLNFECGQSAENADEVVCVSDDEDNRETLEGAVAATVTWDAVEIVLITQAQTDANLARRGGTQGAADGGQEGDFNGVTRLVNHEAIVSFDLEP